MDIIGYELVESFLYGKVVFGLLGLSAILLIIANFFVYQDKEHEKLYFITGSCCSYCIGIFIPTSYK